MLTLLCIATYVKGHEFLRECRRQGCRVLLLTEEKLRDADWPRDSIDAFFYVQRDMPHADIRKGAAHLARTERLDRIVALDDFDVELAAMLREHLFVPGMGETTGRAFRDKLAMRRRARSHGIPCPEFVHVLNHDAIDEWDVACAAAVGAEAAGAGGRHRHQEGAVRRGAVARRRSARRQPRRVPARAVRAGRRLSRRFHCVQPPHTIRGGEQVPDAAHGSGPRRGYLCHADPRGVGSRRSCGAGNRNARY